MRVPYALHNFFMLCIGNNSAFTQAPLRIYKPLALKSQV
nr:MAG TPA_asm: hypothetical protein [Caudoviricetes sp.]